MRKSPYRITATVVDPGTCRFCKEGTSFELNGFTPKGVCDSAYAVLSRDAYALRYGADIPWQTDENSLLTHCPDPTGATWELRRVKREAPEAEARRPEKLFAEGDAGFCEVTVCGAKSRGCPNAIIDSSRLAAAVRTILQDAGVSEHIRQTTTGPLLPHHRFRVAIAACPNACSQPQIRDVGIIAQSVPRQSKGKDLCTGCGLCVDTCREQAIRLVDGGPEIDRQACVNCGGCIEVCPTHAITTRQEGWRLLVGGKLGRHPHLAEELLPLGSENQVLQALRVCLERFVSNGERDERFSDFVTRTGIGTLRGAVSQELRGGSGQTGSQAVD